MDNARFISTELFRDLLVTTDLQYIDLARNKELGDDTLALIGREPNLSSLVLRLSRVSDSSLPLILRDSKSIVNLDVRQTKITDKSMESIAQCHTIRSLKLSYTAITDVGLRKLKSHPALRSLALDGMSIGSQAIAELLDTTRLEHLSLSYTDMSDEDLAVLGQVVYLKTIYVGHTKITLEGVEEFERKNPNLEVRY